MAVTEPALDGTALARLERLGGAALVRQMIELYLTNGPERVQLLADGAASGDAERVQRAAHTMKSSAGNLGAVRLQHTADEIETLAAAGTIDHELVARLVQQFEQSVTELRNALEEMDG
jgi:HPt (histidine-containing phosphotransfer) domain-containing protein